ncbi:hypothetical protein [Metarhizobium album]|uniref:hypothetical protein n=1 Tax=Metarhizobium album TaxID=2182425 RepID=UPI001402860D|nr:hypothetical protein [Rhizobium album]
MYKLYPEALEAAKAPVRIRQPGADFRSLLAWAVGSEGYHDTVFDEDSYSVA